VAHGPFRGQHHRRLPLATDILGREVIRHDQLRTPALPLTFILHRLAGLKGAHIALSNQYPLDDHPIRI
jgi:hypothetical protein